MMQCYLFVFKITTCTPLMTNNFMLQYSIVHIRHAGLKTKNNKPKTYENEQIAKWYRTLDKFIWDLCTAVPRSEMNRWTFDVTSSHSRKQLLCAYSVWLFLGLIIPDTNKTSSVQTSPEWDPQKQLEVLCMLVVIRKFTRRCVVWSGESRTLRLRLLLASLAPLLSYAFTNEISLS